MAKNLLMMGVGKQPQMPPKYGARKSALPIEPIEREAGEYSPAPSTPAESSSRMQMPFDISMHESTGTPESGDHDLKPGAQFSAEVAHYHGADQRCDACQAWDGSECTIWSNASDPGGWCSVFPGDHAAAEKSEAIEPAEPGELDEVAA